MKNPEERQADRFRFLKRLYDETNADIFSMGQIDDVARDIGLTPDEGLAIAQYLTAKHLVQWRAAQGLLSLTEWGVDEVEAAIHHPQEATTNFPPVASLNIIVAESINSPIQQGTHASTQTVTISSGDKDTIATLVTELKATLGALHLSEEARADAEAQLATVEAQLRASNPRRSIIRESLGYLAEILKTAGAAATVLESLRLVLSGLGAG